MKIQREIDGKQYEFKLTPDELYHAFMEQEHIFDMSDIEDLICGLKDDEVFDTYGVHTEEFRAMIPSIAYEMRRNIDKYDMSWEFARDEAATTVLAREADLAEIMEEPE